MIVGNLVEWVKTPLAPDPNYGAIVVTGTSDPPYPAGTYSIFNPGVPDITRQGVPGGFSVPVNVAGPINHSDTVNVILTNASFTDTSGGFGYVGRGNTWACPRAIAAVVVGLNGGVYA
jgi:hypothetical protein